MRTLLFFVILLTLTMGATAQTPIKVPAKTKAVKPVFTNSQGFVLPGNFDDSTHVYQGSKGGLYVYRTSKKTGKIYKYYLPKK